MSHPNTDHAFVKVPPPILTLFFLVLSFLLNRILPISLPWPWMQWLGVVVVSAALILAFLAVRRFAFAHTPLDPHGSVKVLVTDGPYRFSRNPIYVGFVGILIGLPLALGTIWGLILCPALIAALYYFVIRYEEEYLKKKFSGDYTSFKSRVKRWF